MKNKSVNYKPFLLGSVLILVYFILFDFIIPANKIFPKLSLIYESVIELFLHYNLFTGIAITTSVIYISLSIVLMLFLMFKNLTSVLFKLKSFVKIPFFIFILLFAFWFGTAIWGEFIFAFLLIVLHLSYKSSSNLDDESNNFIEFAKINKLKTGTIGKINSHFINERLIVELRKTHFYLWTFIIIYEFINKTGGLGSVIENIYNNYDLAGLFALSIIIYILIFIGDFLYTLIKKQIK